jgi:hypothetical protein
MLLQEARAAGLTVTAEGEHLRIRGPREAEPIVQRLIAHKPDVLTALALETLSPTDLPADWHFLWDERSAIMEHDGGLHRERAEALALTDIVRAMNRAGVEIRN